MSSDQAYPMAEASVDASLNYTFLLATHAACVDGQIHNHEVAFFNRISEQFEIDALTRAAADDILFQRPEMPGLSEVIAGIPREDADKAMQVIFSILHSDGFLDTSESRLIDRLCKHWELSKDHVDKIQVQAKANAEVKQEAEAIADDEKLGTFTRLMRVADSMLTRRVVDGVLSRVGTDALIQRVEDSRNEVLLAGAEYDSAIALCRRIGEEDLAIADEALKQSQAALINLVGGLRAAVNQVEKQATTGAGGGSVSMVLSQLRGDLQALNAEVAVRLRSIIDLQERKRRSIQFFTISFMGKSKAGKSTLHAIVAGGGWDAIGVGKQNTTRLNRVYEWKNLRIIDTPGVKAPNGEEYEKIARSVIDETDLMCWLLTDNNQQQSEFQFLSELKAKGKPLVVLLNVQKNLEDPRRMQAFLDKPEGLFSNGDQQLGGHIERIRRESRKFYGEAEFPIIPAQLLAARLARQETNRERAAVLMRASRLQAFLDAIRVSLINEGQIRRSQNLLGSTVLELDLPIAWVGTAISAYDTLEKTMRVKRKELQDQVSRFAATHRSQLTTAITAKFEEIKQMIPNFAEIHWDSKEDALNDAWMAHVSSVDLHGAMAREFAKAVNGYSEDIEDALKEIGRELELTAKLGTSSARLPEQDSSTVARTSISWSGRVMQLAGAVLMLHPAYFLTAMVLSIGGAILSFFGGLFDSKADKQHKAIAKISRSLESQLAEQHQSLSDDALKQFDAQTAPLLGAVADYFDKLAEGANGIRASLEMARQSITAQRDLLNRCYAFRIFDWLQGRASKLDLSEVEQTIASVDRIQGQRMIVTLRSPLPQNIDLARAARTIQEILEVKIQGVTK